MISTQDDSGRHTRGVNEEKCRFVGEVDLPESERDDPVLSPQPHSSRVSKIWNHYWLSQDDDLCCFRFNTQMSVNIVHTWFMTFSHTDRYGECTSKLKLPSGLWKR